MAKVFISYKRLDRTFAQEFATSLQRDYKHDLAGDLRGIGVAPDYDTTLLKDLAESDVVVFLFTAQAIGSENILSEVGSAKVLNNLLNRPHLIPVVFPGGKLPEPISRVWAQELSSVPGPEELAARINTLIANLRLEPRQSLGDAFPGDKVTVPWLLDHVPVSYWITLAGFFLSVVVGACTIGIRAGQTIPWLPGFAGGKAPTSVDTPKK